MNKKIGKVLGLISIKGGVGKTTSVLNIASSLSNDYNKKVVVVDANFSSPNVALHLGSVDHKNHLHHVLNDEVHIGESLYDSGFGFHFVPSSLVHVKTNFSKLKDTVKILKKHYDYVLIDSSPSLNNELAAAINASDELYVVSTPDIPTLSTTLRAIKLAKGNGMHVKGLILNKMRHKNYEIKPADMERLAGVPVVGIVNNDIKVSEALSELKPVVLHSPHAKSSLNYKQLAAYLSGEEYSHPGKIKLAMSRLKDDYQNFKKHDFKNGFMYYK
ncbi:AAA family ATPase [Candidatus Woesearchaeota archaeon]|nr:MAG: septum site-determining protein MinD [archaeon GW2011_AR18]MBS3161691.1 AAA family ATPase [Candidatus Woesearchaeota archaeon]HIH25701.1 AAA family ATPase [Nanoarchaeota archaeon]